MSAIPWWWVRTTSSGILNSRPNLPNWKLNSNGYSTVKIQIKESVKIQGKSLRMTTSTSLWVISMVTIWRGMSHLPEDWDSSRIPQLSTRQWSSRTISLAKTTHSYTAQALRRVMLLSLRVVNSTTTLPTRTLTSSITKLLTRRSLNTKWEGTKLWEKRTRELPKNNVPLAHPSEKSTSMSHLNSLPRLPDAKLVKCSMLWILSFRLFWLTRWANKCQLKSKRL